MLPDPPVSPQICFVHSIDFSQLSSHNLVTPDLEKVGGNCFGIVLLEKDRHFSVGLLGWTGTEQRSEKGSTLVAAEGVGARQVNLTD